MKNTTENNKLLAEFLGFELTTNKGLKQLPKFHSDWNWLMQVVEKIESLGYNIDTMKYQSSQFCGIYRDGKIIYTNYCETKIEAVYNACLEFVKWYNKNNK